MSCKWKCKFDGRKCNSDRKCNNDKCRCECKKHHICDKCSSTNGKYLASIINDSMISCDEIL